MTKDVAVQRLLLKPNEAAEMLAISPRLLWSITDSGELPCLRIGRLVRYDPTDLKVWINAQKQSEQNLSHTQKNHLI
ncbi:MAG: DNA-binding protein [Phycisphaeraceae bacterium]|nr:DNA-binding protein [Phycisphaeraceae bacterium]MAX27492.1 DNA-binding protein [Phycisphaeraceae bacterium]|tara:strand:- start:155 stop:385 length:231 start_codon:yes stop_codon:yes gene_type:complete